MNSRASLPVVWFGVVLSLGVLPVAAQMMAPEEPQAAKTSKQPTEASADPQQAELPAPDPAGVKASKTFAARVKPVVPVAPAKAAALTPLNSRERVQQLLDRFTFGAKPGDVDRVLATGTDKWLASQLNPANIPDPAADRRLADWPTLTMTPEQALAVLPNRNTVYSVSDGKTPFPVDPLDNAVMEVMVQRWRDPHDARKMDGGPQGRKDLTDDQKAALIKQNHATAQRIVGELLAMPKSQRMVAIEKLSIPDRITLTDYNNMTGDQHNALISDFTPREREAFQAMAGGVDASGVILSDLQQARLVRDVLTERQLLEVMTDFWFNHFNVFGPKDSDTYYTTSYERDVIRKHALGSFKDLLLATAESPAMMVYLDNYLSIGPDSLANGVDPSKPNSQSGRREGLTRTTAAK